MTIPFSKVSIGEEEQAAVAKVLASGWLAAGPETEAFEQEFASYIGVPTDDNLGFIERPYCIFTNSCTSALKIAYKWADERGIAYLEYPKNTFCATYSAGEEIGMTMYEYAPKHDQPNTDPDIRVNMHYGGVKDETPCLIEDSAHRIEANDPLVGKIRCYSFYATKNMTTGSGGMFVTNDKDIYDYARLCWKDGLTTSTLERQSGRAWDYRVEAMAGGYDGNDIAAAIGRVQLRKLPEITRRRNQIRDQYNAALGQSWQGNHLYPYFVDSTDHVGSLIGHLREQGISAGYHYPGTGWLGVSLPIYPGLTDDEVNYVVEGVKSWKRPTKQSK